MRVIFFHSIKPHTLQYFMLYITMPKKVKLNNQTYYDCYIFTVNKWGWGGHHLRKRYSVGFQLGQSTSRVSRFNDTTHLIPVALGPYPINNK